MIGQIIFSGILGSGLFLFIKTLMDKGDEKREELELINSH